MRYSQAVISKRGLFSVEVVSCLDGKARVVMAIPDYQVWLPWGSTEGWYHRRGGIRGEVACGVPFSERDPVQSREYKLDASLCRDCYSAHEVAIGMAAANSRTTGLNRKLTKDDK